MLLETIQIGTEKTALASEMTWLSRFHRTIRVLSMTVDGLNFLLHHLNVILQLVSQTIFVVIQRYDRF